MRVALRVLAWVAIIASVSYARAQNQLGSDKVSPNSAIQLADWSRFSGAAAPVQAVRWTGFLAAPTDGQYTFELVRQYRGDNPTRLWIDEKLVLDSTPTAIDLHGGDPTRFRSQSVALVAGRKTAVRLETTLDAGALKYVNNPDAKLGAALMWQSAALRRELVPGEVFSPPAGFAPNAAAGLKTEFFGDVAMKQPAGTRHTAAIDIFWSPLPPLPQEPDKYDATVKAALAKVQGAGFLDALPTEDLRRLGNDELWPLASHLRLPQRVELTKWLTGQPKLLAAMDDPGMSRLVSVVYLLPGKEHLAMLAAWCAARPQPRLQLNMNSVASAKKFAFYQANFASRGQIGKYFQGPYHEDIFQIWKEHLARPNGECNLGLAYATIAAIVRVKDEEPWLLPKYEAIFKQYQSSMDEVLARKHLKPDARMTWLVASAAGKESFLRFLPAAPYALPDLELALTTAASREYQFWAVQELAIRHCAIGGEGSAAAQFFDEQASKFDTPQEAAQVALWRWVWQYVRGVQDAGKNKQELESVRQYLAELRRRLKLADDNGNQDEVKRLEDIIAAAEKKRLEPLQASLAAQQSGDPELQRLKAALNSTGGVEGWVDVADPNSNQASTLKPMSLAATNRANSAKQTDLEKQATARLEMILGLLEPSHDALTGEYRAPDLKQVKQSLENLIRQFPNTKAAKEAERRLKAPLRPIEPEGLQQ
jgi:hypothetical protein